MTSSIRRYAAIDIGTVTCRLLVADVRDGHLEELRRECAITDLGEGVDATGVLKPEAMQRVDNQIARFNTIIDTYRTPQMPVQTIALATSASRDARNASEFIEMLKLRGVELTVIPGQREAALSFKGASSAFVDEHLLVADIGGGSTELIAGCGGHDPVMKHSFDIGCRRITERFIHSDPPTQADLDEARAWFVPQFAEYFDQMKCTGVVVDRIVAVAGTATTVVSVDRHMVEYDSAAVNGTRVSARTLEQVRARLAGMPLDRRRQVEGLQPGRAPVIVAGLVVLESLLQLAGLDEFTVSESDILQGIILSAAEEVDA